MNITVFCASSHPHNHSIADAAAVLGRSIAQTLALRCPTPMEYVAVDDKFGESGTPDEMLTNYHLRAADIVEKVHKVLTRK